MLAEPLQDEFVVHEALDGLQQEGVEGKVANLLQLELFVDRLQLLQPLGGFLQLGQHLVVLLEVTGELLMDRASRLGQTFRGMKQVQLKSSHLQSTHVPQHHISNPLVVPFNVSVGAPLPDQTPFAALTFHNFIPSAETVEQHLPESQPLVQLLQEAPVELVDGVDVGEQEGHEAFGHGVVLDHRTAEPLREDKTAVNKRQIKSLHQRNNLSLILLIQCSS